MAGTPVSNPVVKVPGGRALEALPVVELSLALGRTPPERVLAAATVLVDQLREMEYGFLASLRGRHFSRSIRSILEYFNLTRDEFQELIQVLGHFKVANSFFNLAVPENDDGLKRYLLDHGVLWQQILFHYEFSLWTPVRFSASFIAGLGYSAASILEVIKDLFDFGVEAFESPSVAKHKIRDFVDGIRQLSLDALVSMAKDEWVSWNKEFSDALYDLDFDKAGFMLGKLAGDLWQLLTGIKALAKLPGMTLKLARKFGGLFAKGIRYSKAAIQLLAELLGKVAAAINEAIEVGFAAVVHWVEDARVVLDRLGEGALIAINRAGDMLFHIPENGLVLEGVGLVDEGWLLGTATGETTTIVARTRVGFDEGLKYVSDLLANTSGKVRQIPNKLRFLQEVKQVEKKAEEYLKLWRDTLQKILRENKIPINPREAGTWIHGHLEAAFDDLAAALSKVYSSMPEIQLRKLAGTLARGPAELKGFLKRADTPLMDFILSRPKIMAALGVSDEQELASFLKAHYKDPYKTRIGDLVSDGILFNEDTRRLISVDWTSGLGKYRFANEFEAALKAGESLSDAQKLELAKTFLKHSLREYAVREAILEHIFVGWETKVIEVMYDPFRFVN
ncbi:MAG: hypothetical protein SFV15_00910 [Polyangiaceae bacterium]|nr:hypothetical protein [Polyangiaceae bacterium]